MFIISLLKKQLIEKYLISIYIMRVINLWIIISDKCVGVTDLSINITDLSINKVLIAFKNFNGRRDDQKILII